MDLYRWSPKLPLERRKQLEGRFRYFRSLGFSEYECEAYAKIRRGDPRLKKLIEEQKWILRELAAYQDVSIAEAARILRRDRDRFIDDLLPGDLIPEEYDPYYRLGYGEEGPPPSRLKKVVYA